MGTKITPSLTHATNSSINSTESFRSNRQDGQPAELPPGSSRCPSAATAAVTRKAPSPPSNPAHQAQELPVSGTEGNCEIPNCHHGHGCDYEPARPQAISQMAARDLQSRVAEKDAGSQKSGLRLLKIQL